MKYSNIFHFISEVFKNLNVSHVLIGGFAVNYYGYTRYTADVDFLITKENFDRLLPSLEREGFQKTQTHEVFVRLQCDQAYLMDLDFMFVDMDTMSKIIHDGKKINIAEYNFIVPSLQHLIALKLHSIRYNPELREFKDLPDIICLLKINKLNPKNKDFQNLCLKYGTQDLYDKIVGGF